MPNFWKLKRKGLQGFEPGPVGQRPATLLTGPCRRWVECASSVIYSALCFRSEAWLPIYGILLIVTAVRTAETQSFTITYQSSCELLYLICVEFFLAWQKA